MSKFEPLNFQETDGISAETDNGLSERERSMQEQLSKLRAELKVAQDEALESDRSKSEFLANISHEIRTPMNAIKGLAELLALTPLNTVQLGYVQNIVKSSNSLLSILSDVLDFSKINANKVELLENPYRLTDLIAKIGNVVNLRATEKGLLLLFEISPSLPKSLIGDDVRVKQVIINIVTNAVKYTSSGHVLIRLFGEKTADGFDLICSVKDTGIGIKEEDIPYLFEAFTQADRKVNHNIQGTGLGLPISDQLIRSMGGSITVESEYGKGSTFTARFPQRLESYEPLTSVENPQDKNVLIMMNELRAKSATKTLDELGISYFMYFGDNSRTDGCDKSKIDSETFSHCLYDDSFSDNNIRLMRKKQPESTFIALKDMKYAMGQSDLHDAVVFSPLIVTELVKALSSSRAQSELEQGSDKYLDDFVLHNTHVLVVDDNDINLIVSEEILRAYKSEVTCADSGRKAIEFCDKTKYDIIFMDHMMPEMDGIETTIALRSGNGLNKTTPIVALTANVVNDMASQYKEAGMDDFISKPLEISDLSRVLLQWLPDEKITTMQDALSSDSQKHEEAQSSSMENLIQSLDTFGMYVTDVMHEIGRDYNLYIKRMDRVRTQLAPLVSLLREKVKEENWDEFSVEIANMASMIHDVGARDCSGRARKLADAGKEHNSDYIKGDFFSLMDNMYMLEKKMEVAVPLALGTISPDVPFGDISYCRDRLLDMESALQEQDLESCIALLDSLAHYSLDHDLDMILLRIGAELSNHDFDAASSYREKALEHCAKFLDGSNQVND